MTWNQVLELINPYSLYKGYLLIKEDTNKRQFKLTYIPLNYVVSAENIFEIESKKNCTRAGFVQYLLEELQCMIIKGKLLHGIKSSVDSMYKGYLETFANLLLNATPIAQQNQYLYYDIYNSKCDLISTIYTNKDAYAKIKPVKNANFMIIPSGPSWLSLRINDYAIQDMCNIETLQYKYNLPKTVKVKTKHIKAVTEDYYSNALHKQNPYSESNTSHVRYIAENYCSNANATDCFWLDENYVNSFFALFPEIYLKATE